VAFAGCVFLAETLNELGLFDTRISVARVLVIEDDDLLRGLLRSAFTRAGWSVSEARDGSEGLASYARTPVDVVITDILMPEKEGLETIRELNAQSPGVKIIAISGGGKGLNLDVLDIAKRFGATVTLEKPFDLEKLLELAKELLSRPGTA
jgi:DNA-binding response OmpR family regulator